MKLNKCFFIAAAILLFASSNYYSQTIEQWLDVVRNDEVVGGELHVEIKVKGTNLTAANTLGSLTIDVIIDVIQIELTGVAQGVIVDTDGYSIVLSVNDLPLTVNPNDRAVRFGFTGGNIGPGFLEKDGHDVSVSYETYITLQFTILDDQLPADLLVDNLTNQVGLFNSHSNSNNSGVINDQILSEPINIFNEPLPVELVSFSANYSGSKVGLEWATATEIDNYGFQIERKSVEEENAQWRKLGFVAGSGNSNKNINYQFSDENLNSDHYFYRLKQIDNDGSYTYSDEVEVKFDLIVEDFTLTQNYPNPFNPSTQIKFGFKESTQASLRVYNTIGELVSELFNAKTESGNIYTVTFNADKLPSGMYLYELRGNNSVEVRKMLLLK